MGGLGRGGPQQMMQGQGQGFPAQSGPGQDAWGFQSGQMPQQQQQQQGAWGFQQPQQQMQPQQMQGMQGQQMQPQQQMGQGQGNWGAFAGGGNQSQGFQAAFPPGSGQGDFN